MLGTVLFRNKKDLNAAETAFQKSVRLDQNSDALIKLGEAQAAKGEVDQAIATYQQAIKDHPRNANFNTLLGELYESKRDWKQAQAAYKVLAAEGGGSIRSLSHDAEVNQQVMILVFGDKWQEEVSRFASR